MAQPDVSPEEFGERQATTLLDLADGCDALAANGGNLPVVLWLRDTAKTMRVIARGEQQPRAALLHRRSQSHNAR